MNARSREQSARDAWFISGPGPDERLGSVVDRAAALYRCTADQLLSSLVEHDEGRVTDIDGAGAPIVLKMAHAIQVPPKILWRHRLPDHSSLLVPDARQAYCPMCWREDRDAGREPGLRRDWAGVLRTMCSHHGVPMRLPGPLAWGREAGLPLIGSHPAMGDWAACIAAIDHFARTLEGALFFAQEWPADWKMSPTRVRAALLAVSLNLGSDEDFAPLSRLVHASPLSGLVRVPSHAMSPVRGDPWEAFRAIADPAVRRAALWLVGWWTCPTWSEAWRPGWVDRKMPLKLWVDVERGLPVHRRTAPPGFISH